jgi:pimeloyl-ACP methyl ester carboxylesterase
MPDIQELHRPQATTAVAARSADPGGLPTAFLLVHGGWHGAWCYERVIPLLAARGHAAMARDLPGHGLDARFPASYGNPARRAAFAAESSPLAAIGIDDYAGSVIAAIDALRAGGHRKVVLVGHSMGGIVLNAVGERAPEKVDALVYLAAHMPGSEVAIGAYFGMPEAAGALVNPVLVGDPFALGAFRLDTGCAEAGYRAGLRQAFYNDASDADFGAVANLLTPDMPLKPMTTPIALSASRWGAIERHYIVCARDNALPPALARRFIADADALAPHNRTHVHELDTGHSSFVTAPQALAGLLLAIAASGSSSSSGSSDGSP